MTSRSSPRQRFRWLWRAARERTQRAIKAASLRCDFVSVANSRELTRFELSIGKERQTAWLPGRPDEHWPVARAARRSRYGKLNRFGGSVLHGCLARGILGSSRAPLRCLFVGYGHDTYDAQLLANLGYRVEAEFVDVLDPAPVDPRWAALHSSPGVLAATYHQADARRLALHLQGRDYDLISVARGSLDLLPAADWVEAARNCWELLSPEGVAILSAITLRFVPVALSGIRQRLWLGQAAESSGPRYNSALGTFSLSQLDYPRWVDPLLPGGSPALEPVIAWRLERFARQDRRMDDLLDVLAIPPNADWLTRLATCSGQFGQVVGAADLPGPVQAGAFDLYEKPRDRRRHWGFVARTTLAMRRAG
jgi:hypothetical protein